MVGVSDEVRLEVLSGPAAGRVIRLCEPDRFVVGRSTGARIRIVGDGFVSREHLVIEVAPPQARLRDLGSKNGVLVNGRRYGGIRPAPPHVPQDDSFAVDLHDGDEIQLGATRIRFVAAETRGSPEPSNTAHFFTRGDREILGRYEVEPGGPLRGGMGEVFVARDRETARRVAIKTMVPGFRPDLRQIRGFLRECNVATKLEHPNIVRAWDAGFADGRFYLVMEYVAGHNLRERLVDGPMTLEEAAPVMLGILDGLAYAHTERIELRLPGGGSESVRGVVHRDLKPENIMLGLSSEQPSPEIVDFGLAKAFDATGRFSLTSDGQMAGTVHYWPREQIVAYRYLGPPSDVFSAAAVIYEMLAGCYVRDGFRELVERLRREPPLAAYACMILRKPVVPLAERRPDLPAAVVAVIDRALAEEETVLELMSRDEALAARERLANLRFPDGGAFRDALRSALESAHLSG